MRYVECTPCGTSAATLEGKMAKTSNYVAFAARFSITEKDAYVLPALFEGAARKVGMHPEALLSQATYSNPALGAYLAEAARKVAEQDRGA
jgi:hypothetical protein